MYKIFTPASTSNTLNYSPSPHRPTSIHDTRMSSELRYGTGSVIQREEVEVNPESLKKLEEEFTSTRSQLHESVSKVRDRSRELSDQKIINSELRSRARSISPPVSPIRSRKSISVIERENEQLESKVATLRTEIKVAVKDEGRPVQTDERTLEIKMIEEEYTNFLLRYQTTEFQHLKRLLIIFQEENIRLNSLLTNGQKPSDTDVFYIKDNIRKIREEIEAILNGRTSLTLKFQQMQETIHALMIENKNLKEYKSRMVDRSVSQPPPPPVSDSRDRKIKALLEEIEILKRDLEWAQITKPDAGLVYRLEHENSILQTELSHLKTGASQLETMQVDRPLEYYNDMNPTEQTTIVHTINMNENRSMYGGRGTVDDAEYTLRGREDHKEEISHKQLEELNTKVKEFEDCNVELEELILRLRGKIEGGAEQYYSGSNYGSRDRKYKSVEGEMFQQLLNDLKVKVDKICLESARGNAEATKMLFYLEKMLRDSESTKNLFETQKVVLTGQQSINEELVLLKQAYQKLEIKFTSLLGIHQQDEIHIDKQNSQITDLRKKIAELIEENQTYKIKERDADKEASENIRARLRSKENYLDSEKKYPILV